MTLLEIVRDAYEGIGEPSDLEYKTTLGTVDTASAGWSRFVSAVNDALVKIATWRMLDGRYIRLRMTEALTAFRSEVVSGTVGSYTGNTLIAAGLVQTTDYYKNWLVVTAGGAVGIVLTSYASGGNTAFVLVKVTGTPVAAEAFTLAKREYEWVDSAALSPPIDVVGIPANFTTHRPLEIVSITDIEDETVLTRTERLESNVPVSTTASTPSQYEKIYNGIRLNVYPDAERYYYVRYLRAPRLFTINDQAVECDLPPQYHRIVTLYVQWWGLQRAQELDTAYARRRDMEDLLRQTASEFALENQVTRGQAKLYDEYSGS